MAKTMAEVLAEHRHNEGIELSGRIYTWCLCEGLDGWRAYGVSGPRAYAEHLEVALSAAGFGLVADAKAEALLTMADRLENARDMTWNGSMRKVNGWASAADFLRQYSEQAGIQS